MFYCLAIHYSGQHRITQLPEDILTRKDIQGVLAVLLSTVVLTSCSVSSPIKKIQESESEFSEDPAKRLKPIKGNPEIFRIYDRAASGFVSIGATREGLEERARKFCEDKDKNLKVLESEQSNPPYILGNFPRMELIFICEEKSSHKSNGLDNKISQIGELKKLLDSGALTKTEFDTEKHKLLSK